MGTTLEKLQAVQNSKDAIKAALEDKGMSPSNVFSTYPSLISELENTSDATATSESILEGETAYTAEGKTTGTAVGGIPIVTTAGDGNAYTATVSNFPSLVVGKKITIIPHVTSAKANPTLNVNELGAKYIRQRLSTTTSTTTAGQSASWLVANKPITVMYDGTYWVADLVRPDANTFYGTLDINQGGTGATTAEAALENLGAVGKADIVDNLLSTATDAPLSANQGRVLAEAFQDGCDTLVAGCTTYGSTPASNSPEDIVKAIGEISTNRYNEGVTATKVGTAVAADVLSGKTFTNASGVGLSGSMTNRGAVSKSITPSASTQTYTIPKGYHNGSGKVTVAAQKNTLVKKQSFTCNGVEFKYLEFGKTLTSLPVVCIQSTYSSSSTNPEATLCSDFAWYNGSTTNIVTAAPVTGVRLRCGIANRSNVTATFYVFASTPST